MTTKRTKAKEEIEQIKEALRKKEQDFRALQKAFLALSTKANLFEEMSLLLNPAADKKEAVQLMLQQTQKAIEAEAGAILLRSSNGEELFFAAATGPKAEQVRGLRFPATEGIAGWVLREKQPVTVNDVERDQRFYREISDWVGYEVRNIICVPLRARNQTLGVIELLNKIGKDRFDPDDLEILQGVGRLAGLVLEALLFLTRTPDKNRAAGRPKAKKRS